MLGNDRLRVLPVWELTFGNMAEGDWPIATEKVKHDTDYQERRQILHGPAKNLAPEVAARIQAIAKRIYRTLELDGYARIDFRLSADGVPYFLEANPNPEIAESQEFAAAAKHDGIKYRDLLHRILTLGMQAGRRDGGAGREGLRPPPAGLICGTTKQRSLEALSDGLAKSKSARSSRCAFSGNTMEISLSGRTAIVTGGSKGIGFAVATRFAASGADVAIVARTEGPLKEAVGTSESRPRPASSGLRPMSARRPTSSAPMTR